jgi:predicted esterase
MSECAITLNRGQVRPQAEIMTTRSIASILALVLACTAAAATPRALHGQAGNAAAEMRDRLGLSYLQLELALAAAGSGVDRAALNREFDRATLLFFAGNMNGALAVIDSMAAAVPGAPADVESRARARLDSLNAQRRVHTSGAAQLPYLVHVPRGSAPAGGWPVVVAVHGAGGDERMFFGGYGAGVIRELADRHGVAVITPAAPLGADVLFALVDAASREHGLDAGRVALVGHSMGAGIVAQATGSRPERVRAVACLAGSCAAAAGSSVPVMVVAGALDPLFRVNVLEDQASALRTSGRTVEFRRLETEGHTLVVGHVLQDVMQWMVDRLR